MSGRFHILLKTSLALSEQFQTTLDTSKTSTPENATTATTTTSTTSTSSQTHPDPLNLLSDSTKTLRAQVTKLSLLSITVPFTPSALSTSLAPVNDSVMPSMVTAALLLTSAEYTTAFTTEARLLVKTALKEFSVLVEQITNVAARKFRTKDQGEKEEDLPKSEKDAITSQTGRIWDACDSITTLVTRGVVGHVIRRVQEWHDLVKDAISELEEWDPEEDDVDFVELPDLNDDGEEEENNTTKKTSLGRDEEAEEDNIEALQTQKKALLRALKPIAQIYPAIISNRIKKGGLTATKSQIAKLESLSSDLSSIPNHVDEAAGSLYESNLDDSVHYLKVAKSTAERAIELVTFPWVDAEGSSSTITAEQQQQEDKFTVWSRTWKKVMGDVIRDIRS